MDKRRIVEWLDQRLKRIQHYTESMERPYLVEEEVSDVMLEAERIFEVDIEYQLQQQFSDPHPCCATVLSIRETSRRLGAMDVKNINTQDPC